VITRIEIDGFKSFVDFSLDVPQLLVLVGANNGGKSNLLQALSLFQDLQLGGEALALEQGDRGSADFHRDIAGREVDALSIAVDDHFPSARVDLVRESYTALFRPDRSPESVGQWLFAKFQPRLMRRGSDESRSPRVLLGDGSNVARVVASMRDGGHARTAYGNLLMDLAAVLPGFADLISVYDERRRTWDLDFVFDTGRRLPCSMVSDGTLRVLGVLVAVHSLALNDGTLLIDEIEIGLHPAFLVTLVDRIRRRVRDYRRLQVIATTHSPVVVSEVVAESPESVVFIDQVYGALAWPDGEKSATERTRARPVAASGERGSFVSPREVRRYLETVRPVDLA
jgi:predicted ATPase